MAEEHAIGLLHTLCGSAVGAVGAVAMNGVVTRLNGAHAIALLSDQVGEVLLSSAVFGVDFLAQQLPSQGAVGLVMRNTLQPRRHGRTIETGFSIVGGRGGRIGMLGGVKPLLLVMVEQGGLAAPSAGMVPAFGHHRRQLHLVVVNGVAVERFLAHVLRHTVRTVRLHVPKIAEFSFFGVVDAVALTVRAGEAVLCYNLGVLDAFDHLPPANGNRVVRVARLRS